LFYERTEVFTVT